MQQASQKISVYLVDDQNILRAAFKSLLAQDERFWVVRFNIAMSYLGRGDRARALDYFRQLIDSQPDKSPEVAHMAAQAPLLREICEGDGGFAQDLQARCPEMFASPEAAEDPTAGGLG